MFDQEEALMSKQGVRVETANSVEVRAGSWRAAVHMPGYDIGTLEHILE